MSYTLNLSGRIDISNAAETEKELMSEIDAHGTDRPDIDASELTYISSAGLRVLMKIRKRFSQSLAITEVSEGVYDILSTTGFTELFDVKKRLREISVEGCEVIGKGFYGTVYRLDEETIVKVYEPGCSVDIIEDEQQKAKTAFVKGIPTAISYDMVRVGDSYGAVYELFRSETLNDIIIKHPEQVDDIIGKYVAFIRQIHSLRAYGVALPTASGRFWHYLEFMKDEIGDEMHDRLKKMISELPYDDKFIHGDLQMKNVMMCDGEMMLIDMDTMSKGQPIFDLQALYVTYMQFLEDDPGNSMAFLGITSEMSRHIWNRVIRLYLGSEDEAIIRKAEDKIRILAYVRFLYIILSSDLKGTDLGRLRIKHAKEGLADLCSRVSDLAL